MPLLQTLLMAVLAAPSSCEQARVRTVASTVAAISKARSARASPAARTLLVERIASALKHYRQVTAQDADDSAADASNHCCDLPALQVSVTVLLKTVAVMLTYCLLYSAVHSISLYTANAHVQAFVSTISASITLSMAGSDNAQ